jgi:hypothetical protein
MHSICAPPAGNFKTLQQVPVTKMLFYFILGAYVGYRHRGEGIGCVPAGSIDIVHKLHMVTTHEVWEH